jgi:hypothetical protein
MRPEKMIPGSVATEALLVRTDAVAVAAGGFRAYPNGFEFTVHVRQRREDAGSLAGLSDPFGRRGRLHGAPEPGRALRLGVLYPDGRRAATFGHRPFPDQVAPDELIVLQGGSHGSDYRWDGEFWVHPLPPDGPLTLVTSWLEKGVAETRAQVDGRLIRAAASHAIELWPGDPDPEPRVGWTSSTHTASRQDPPPPPAAPPED